MINRIKAALQTVISTIIQVVTLPFRVVAKLIGRPGRKH